MLCYLASPYSHPDTAIMEQRRVAVCRAAGDLIASGVAVISPIAHNVAILRETGVTCGWAFWREQDLALLSACNKLLVLQLPGWEDSIGVRAELAAARQLGMTIEFIPPPTRPHQLPTLGGG